MADTGEIRDLIQVLLKAKKNFRIYPENNPMYQKTIDDLLAALTKPLEYTEEIPLRIKQYKILYEGEVVYENTDKDESLALFFFKDGVRELTFRQGIMRDEVEDFLQIISLDFEKDVLDDDIVTLMWEKDFRHISYVVDDTILLDDHGYEEEATREALESGGGEEDIMKAYEEAFGVERPTSINIVPLTNDDLKSIIEEIENEPTDKTMILTRTLFEMLYISESKTDFSDVAELMKKTIQYAVEHANLETPVYTVRQIRKLLESGEFSGETAQILRGVDLFLNSSALIRAFGEVMDSGAEFETSLIEDFSGILSKKAIPHLIAILGELKNMASRKTVISILTELGREAPGMIARGLADKRWYVVRNIIYILRQIGDRSVLEYLTRSVRHSDIRVRKEAIRALGEMGSGEVINILRDCIHDPDESIRISAVRAIGQIGTALSRKIILEEIQSKPFREKGFTEKKEYFEALSRWPDETTVELLVEILRKSPFFKRAKHDETRAAAAFCAGIIKARKAEHVLMKLRSSKNRLLREHVISALQRIKDVKV
jgi:HEAT repeat protein